MSYRPTQSPIVRRSLDLLAIMLWAVLAFGLAAVLSIMFQGEGSRTVIEWLSMFALSILFGISLMAPVVLVLLSGTIVLNRTLPALVANSLFLMIVLTIVGAGLGLLVASFIGSGMNYLLGAAILGSAAFGGATAGIITSFRFRSR